MSQENKRSLREADTLPRLEGTHRARRRRSLDASYQERLRALASEVALAAERERRRIATGLHDEVGQLLALAKMKVGAAAGPQRHRGYVGSGRFRGVQPRLRAASR